MDATVVSCVRSDRAAVTLPAIDATFIRLAIILFNAVRDQKYRRRASCFLRGACRLALIEAPSLIGRRVHVPTRGLVQSGHVTRIGHEPGASEPLTH
jgi:hypothetical protein